MTRPMPHSAAPGPRARPTFAVPAVLAATLLLASAAPAVAYIDMKVENLTIPRLLLEYKTVGVFRVERMSLESGAVLFAQVEGIQGRDADGPVKHSILGNGKLPPALTGLDVGDRAVLFREDDYGRAVTFLRGKWYVSNWDHAAGVWRIGYTDDHHDFKCAFLGSMDELAEACRALLAGRKVTVRCRKERKKEQEQFVRYDLRRPHDKLVVAAPPAADGVDGPGAPDGAEIGVTALMERLCDPNADVRLSAADALGRMGAKAAPAVEALAERFAESKKEDALVRRSAAVALGRIGPPARSALPALLAGVVGGYGDTPTLAGFEAAVAVGRIDPDGSGSLPILRTMRQDGNGTIRRRAVEAPGLIGPTMARSAAFLAEAMEDASAGIRAAAARSMGCIRPDPAVAVPALLAGLNDENQFVRRNAGIALGELGPAARSGVAALADAVAGHADVEVRRWAAEALGRIGPDARAAIPVLTAALTQDPSNDVRYRAKQALRRIALK